MANTSRLRLIITNEYGDKTDVAVSMPDSKLESVYNAIHNALLGSQFHPELVEQFFPYIEEYDKTL